METARLFHIVEQGAEHGIGFKNMPRVVRKYMGDLSFEQKGDEVTVEIMLQIVKSSML